jgi:tetratricopeptide (TPR) repeat protein
MALLHREMGKDILDKLFGGEKKGSQQAAARALERLIAEHPRSDLVEPALIDQAELYQAGALNDPARSNQYYQELLKKNPETSHPVFFQIAKNYESLGDKPRAREYYQRYLEKEPAGKFSSDARRKLKELK